MDHSMHQLSYLDASGSNSKTIEGTLRTKVMMPDSYR
jgi:hypothetical protein